MYIQSEIPAKLMSPGKLVVAAPLVEVLGVANGVVLERRRQRLGSTHDLPVVHQFLYDLPPRGRRSPVPAAGVDVAGVYPRVLLVHGDARRRHATVEAVILPAAHRIGPNIHSNRKCSVRAKVVKCEKMKNGFGPCVLIVK